MQIDAKSIKDLINKKFQKKYNNTKAIISLVIKSQTNQNIVLTTTEDFSAEYLQQNEIIWKKKFKYNQFIKNIN